MIKEVIARYTHSGQRFEILVDSEKVQEYKENENTPIRDILIGDYVFTDLSKAERAKDELLLRIFKTTNIEEISEHIIKHGEIQLTTEQRKEALDEKKKKIITHISRHAIDPKTNYPHPPKRIETAMDEAKVQIDPLIKAENQIKDVIKQLRTILPLSIENKIVAFNIPIKHAGTARSIITRAGNIKKEEWSGQQWIVEVDIPAGLLDELFSKVNSITHGENESKIIDKTDHNQR